MAQQMMHDGMTTDMLARVIVYLAGKLPEGTLLTEDVQDVITWAEEYPSTPLKPCPYCQDLTSVEGWNCPVCAGGGWVPT